MKYPTPLKLLLVPFLVLALIAFAGIACGDDDDDDGGDDVTPTATEEPAGEDPTDTPEPGPDPTDTPEPEPTDAPEPTPDDDADNGGGPAEVTISAQDLAFSTGRIELTAGQETEVVFTNNDATIPHNVHIVAGDVEGSMAPFSGNDGPTMSFSITIEEPGSYTFQCDIHPSMSGSVEVS